MSDPRNGHVRIDAIERRLRHVESDLSDFRRQTEHEINQMKQAIESKERVVLELKKQIAAIKGGGT